MKARAGPYGSYDNDPFGIGQHYLDCVRQLGGIPKIIKADCGTENVNVAVARVLSRSRTEFFVWKIVRQSAHRGVVGTLKRGCMAWWIGFFKDLRDYGIYSEDDVKEVECLRFCFMNIISEE